eukprot:12252947-Karenia_brevis.AAC.1
MMMMLGSGGRGFKKFWKDLEATFHDVPCVCMFDANSRPPSSDGLHVGSACSSETSPTTKFFSK